MTSTASSARGGMTSGQHDQTNGFALYGAAHPCDVDNVVRSEFGQHEASVGDLAQQALCDEQLGRRTVCVP